MSNPHNWQPSTVLTPHGRIDCTRSDLEGCLGSGYRFVDIQHINWLKAMMPPVKVVRLGHGEEWVWLTHIKRRPFDAYNHQVVTNYPAFAFVRERDHARMTAFHCFIHSNQWPILRLCATQFLAEWTLG